jgi:hypothetical protein
MSAWNDKERPEMDETGRSARRLLLLRRAIVATIEVTKATNAPHLQRGLARKERLHREAVRRVARLLITDGVEPSDGAINFACGD